MLAVIAFILAGAAAFLVKVFLERQAQPVVVQQEQRPTGMAKVLVASRNINPGEVLSAKDVSWAEWPQSLVEERMILESEFVIPSATVPPTQVGLVVRPEVPGEEMHAEAKAETGEDVAAKPAAKKTEGEEPGVEDAAAKLTEEGDDAEESQGPKQMAASTGDAESDIVGAVARRRILANEPISPDALINRGDRSVGAAVVSPGMRAISIKISAETGAGGFIAPGDYVDVLLTIEHKIKMTDEKGKEVEGMAVTLADGDSLWKFTTETVMRSVKVLAIDQSLARDEDAGPADVGKTATLEVSPRDAEKLLTAAALSRGSLTLVLRSLVVDQTVQDEVDAFEDPFNFNSDIATSRAMSALFTSSSLYGYGPGGSSVRVNRGGAVSQEGF